MVDVNLATDVKAIGIPTVPAIETEDRKRPQVAPVREGSDSSGMGLDDKALHGRAGGKRRVSEDELNKEVKHIQQRLEDMGTRLGLTVSHETDDILVQVTNRDSGELIRQIPSEEVVKLRQKLEELAGILFDDHV
ncbi:MAG: flagellar protein FlaG [Proteobacteria bacterium]|nr:flagellar protein FlaG [Pseudomonadota bacterium]MBU1686216.1 flagellar protein FlaG [Pseudomonadota bacterium]